jgi:hypothetical protein
MDDYARLVLDRASNGVSAPSQLTANAPRPKKQRVRASA